MSDMYRQALFSVPLFRTKAKHHDKIREHVDHVIDDIKTNNTQPTNPEGVPLNIWSDYFPESGIESRQDTYDLYLDDLKEFMEFAGYKQTHNWKTSIRAWMNIGGKGSMQEEHAHICHGVTWSAVHYVKFDPEQHIPTVFINPLFRSHWELCQPTNIAEEQPYEWGLVKSAPEVEEGDLVIFPAWLRHESVLHQSEELRATVAINFTIFGEDDL